MKVTEVLSAEDNHALLHAQAILQEGGIVAFPTDTVYGVGTLAFHAEAIETLYSLKGRESTKAIALLLGERHDVPLVTREFSLSGQKLADKFWPGPLTLILPSHSDLPAILSPQPTIGIRIPDHPVAQNLLSLVGPMAVSSANLSGQPETHTAGEVLLQMDGRIDLVIDGGRTPGDRSSTVVDITQEPPKILRLGPISEEEILAAL